MLLRLIVAALFVLLAGAQVIRTAAVADAAEERPQSVIWLWPGHPSLLRSIAMAEVGFAAGRGEEPSPLTLARFAELARAAPLASHPFIVHGALAQREGEYARAEKLLSAARRRDPRSPAARFLLADIYFRSGRLAPGLAETALLGRLMPEGRQQLAPALAEFARAPGALPQLRRILGLYPELEPALLAHLARDSRNAELILALVPPEPGQEAAPWQARLLEELVEEGDYDRAHAIWARLSGVTSGAGRGLFNADFQPLNAPPPFNWALSSAGGGVAEPSGEGLRILYYGREDSVLAGQLLMLRPGPYRLEMRVAGTAAGGTGLRWTLACLPGSRQVLDLPLSNGAGGESAVAGEFRVPADDCAAQRLELKGSGQEFARSEDVRISRLRLSRIGG